MCIRDSVRPQEDSGSDSALQANGSNNPTEPLLGLYLQPRRHTGGCRSALPCQRFSVEPDDRRGGHGVEQRQRGGQQSAAQIQALEAAHHDINNTPVEQTNFVLPGVIFFVTDRIWPGNLCVRARTIALPFSIFIFDIECASEKWELVPIFSRFSLFLTPPG